MIHNFPQEKEKKKMPYIGIGHITYFFPFSLKINFSLFPSIVASLDFSLEGEKTTG